MPFRAQLEECTCLTSIPSSNQGIRSELNSRNPAILPLRHHQKPCRSPYKVQYLGLTAAKSPSGGHVPLGAIRFQTTWQGTRIARRQAPQTRKHSSHRLAGQPPPPGAQRSRTPLFQPQPPSGSTFTARRTLH